MKKAQVLINVPLVSLSLSYSGCCSAALIVLFILALFDNAADDIRTQKLQV